MRDEVRVEFEVEEGGGKGTHVVVALSDQRETSKDHERVEAVVKKSHTNQL